MGEYVFKLLMYVNMQPNIEKFTLNLYFHILPLFKKYYKRNS